MKKIRITLSLFDGISCGLQSLKNNNIIVDKYYASEIDKYAIEVSEKNHPEIIRLGDVKNWRDWDIEWDKIDLLIGGSPCQGFTFSGKRLNFEDERSKLFFVYNDILEFIKTKNPNVKFLLENVRMEKKIRESIDEYIGVKGVLINSNLFSAQNRQRYYWTNIVINNINNISSSLVLKDIVNYEDNNNIKCYISKQHLNAWLKSYKNWRPNLLDEKAKPLLATYYKQPPHCPYIPYRDINSDSNVEDSNKYSIYRRLSPLECERLQTLPDDYTLVINNKGKENSYSQRWKMLGNGWTCKVIDFILKNND